MYDWLATAASPSATSSLHHQSVRDALPPACHSPVQPEEPTEMTGGYAPGKLIPSSPSLPAATTTMTPAAMAASMAAFSTASSSGPPRLMLMTTGLPASGPRLSPTM